MFKSFISLGWFCGTASSMSEYGLRCISGPFDWCFSELEGIMELMNDDFRDFLNKRNLRVDENEPTRFRDIKYDITYVHEVKQNFEAEYNEIVEKYVRRINKFKDSYNSERPVCFIRAVHKPGELEYIVKNGKHINEIIKRFNAETEIVFLVPKFMSVPQDFAFKAYILDIDKYEGAEDTLKTLFDTNEEFITWCCENMDEQIRQRNLSFRNPVVTEQQNVVLQPQMSGHISKRLIKKALRCIRGVKG